MARNLRIPLIGSMSSTNRAIWKPFGKTPCKDSNQSGKNQTNWTPC